MSGRVTELLEAVMNVDINNSVNKSKYLIKVNFPRRSAKFFSGEVTNNAKQSDRYS